MQKLLARMSGVMAVAMAAAAAVACGKVQAKTPAPTPSLTMPDPPPRAVMPAIVDLSAPPPAIEKPAAPAATRPTTTTTRPAATPVATPVATPTPSPTPPVADPPVLQTPASQVQLEKNARETLDRATKSLQRIKRDTLGADARDQFDSANRYIQLATDAIQAKNFVYAVACAERAATLVSLIK